MPPRVQPVDAAALVARLRQHDTDAEVQAQCCRLLMSSQLSDETALAFLPAIVAALRAHPGHSKLQAYGCAVLGTICRGRSGHLAGVAGVADGVRAIVGAMRTHPAIGGLQSTACCALNLMFISADGLCDVAVDAGAVPAMVAALRAHVLCDDADVIAGALGRLFHGRPTATAQAGAAGAVAATVTLLRAHPASAAVQLAGCSVMGSLASDAESQKTALECGAFPAVVLALSAHAADVSIQTYGCRAL
jgi:hypothetical protein